MTNNPNNYPGATVSPVVGLAGGEYTVREFPNGGSQAQLSIAVGKGYKDKNTDTWVDTGTDWYTLVASTDYAADNWPEVGKGDTVRVDDARLECRPYTKNDGTAAADLQLRFGTLVVVKKKEDRGASNVPAAGLPF
jgi:single-stranded DNA-binding protein